MLIFFFADRFLLAQEIDLKASPSCKMLPILQACLQEQMPPQQAVHSYIYIVSGIFHYCPEVFGKRRAVSNASNNSIPLIVKILNIMAIS